MLTDNFCNSSPFFIGILLDVSFSNKPLPTRDSDTLGYRVLLGLLLSETWMVDAAD